MVLGCCSMSWSNVEWWIRIAWIQLGRGHILHLWRQDNRGAKTHQQQYQPKFKRTTWLMNLRVCRSFWDLAYIVGSWKGTDWVSVAGVTETIGYHSPETWKSSLVVPWAMRLLFSGNVMWQRNTIHLVPWFSHFKPQFMIIYVCIYIYIWGMFQLATFECRGIGGSTASRTARVSFGIHGEELQCHIR